MRSYCHIQENKFLKLLYEIIWEREREKERNTCLKILEKTSRERNHSSPTITRRIAHEKQGNIFTLWNECFKDRRFFSFSFLLLLWFVFLASLCSCENRPKMEGIKSISINTQKKRPRSVCVFIFFFTVSFQTFGYSPKIPSSNPLEVA